jgi:putative redox protein
MERATITWIDGKKFNAHTSKGYNFTIDGEDEVGVGAMDLLLFGLAGCTTITIIPILKKQRQSLEDITVNITGERAEEPLDVYERIHIEYILKGDLDHRKVERAIHLSETKICPASAMLKKTAEITHNYRIIPSDAS